jgi:hypothetical protein
MALPATVLKDKQTIIKEREGERLARYLRILFGKEKFGFKWSHRETSYTDGKDIYILYELQRPDCRLFTPAELCALRKGHSIHERGHIEYDVIEDYRKWQEEWMSKDRNEWIANEKYPLPWLQYFGNVMMDGRMENFTAIDHPTTKEYFDLGNYEWRFGIRGQHAGENVIFDFRECFMSRALGMTDIDEWTPDSVALVDSIQDLIEIGRMDESTHSVLATTMLIIKKVWPTLIEWMDVQNEDPANFDYQDDHQDSTWGSQDEVEENVKRVLVKVAVRVKADESDESSGGSSSGSDDEEGQDPSESGNDDTKENEPSKPDFSKVVRLEEKSMEKDEQEAVDTLGPYSERKQEVTVWEHREDRKSYSSTVKIKPFDEVNEARYDKTYREIKRHVTPTAKALSALLEPVADEERRNQRSGKLKVNRVWRTEALGEANVFDRRKKGTPGKNARILILNDVSGSTSSQFPGTSDRIIDQMRKAQTLLIESCEAANVPVAAYGFTEEYGDYSTVIYPFKPYGRFTHVEKGFIGGMDSRWGNRDTLALQWAVDELAKYPEDVRLLIMLSDGEPCFEDGETYDTMRSIVQQAEKRGIDILCLYVGPQYANVIDRVHYMYPGKSIVVSKHMTRELTRHVKRIIRKRK